MSIMFWVWLGVIVLTVIIEAVTMELVSIWFTVGAIIPFILSACNVVGWEIQIVIFIVISALLIISLRSVTKRFLLKNSNEKTNLNLIIGQKVRMLSRTDFETIGSVKINDVIWSAIDEKQSAIEVGEIVEIVKVQGNKLIVKKTEENNTTGDIKNSKKNSKEDELKNKTKEEIIKEENQNPSKITKKMTNSKTKNSNIVKKSTKK